MAGRILRNRLYGCPIASPCGRGWFRVAVPGLAVALALLALPGLCRAVTFQEQAERLQLIYAFLLDLRPGQAPRLPAASLLDLSLEILPFPDIDNRVGAKDEQIDPPAAIPRLRVRYLSASAQLDFSSCRRDRQTGSPVSLSNAAMYESFSRSQTAITLSL